MIGAGDGVSDEPKNDRASGERKSDPQEDAERRLRQMLAIEGRRQREQIGKIQKGFYGCVGLIVLGFLVLLFFF
jgi:hypothetical protein